MNYSMNKINILYLFKLKTLFSIFIGLFLCGCDFIKNNDRDILYPDSVVEIWNQADLDNIRHCLSCDYILMADIELITGRCGFDPLSGWLPIGSVNNNEYFTGVFDGNNRKITGLWIDRVEYVGLFEGIKNAQIKNLSVETADGRGIKGDEFVGAIAGTLLAANITDSYVTGNINGIYNVGGVAGRISFSSNIINSHVAGNISASKDNAGGIAGFAQMSSIAESNFTGNVKGGGQFIGGIVGTVTDGNITDSYSSGSISGDAHIGGITGNIKSEFFITNPFIANSGFTGNVTGRLDIGGVAGNIKFDSFIINSYSNGNIIGNESIGGIAGYIHAANITNSYSAGNINGNDSLGGIVGTTDGANIINIYSIGNINGNDSLGGIAGWADGANITNGYFAGEIEGVTNVGGIAGRVALDSSIKYTAAVNPSIVGGINNINRIIGVIMGSNDISDNLALDTMKIKGTVYSGAADKNNGISKTENGLKTKSTYEAMSWKFGNDDINPWKIDKVKNGGFPYLYWQQ
jgi:hypothetical protein